jgi:hypothetical protein
MTAVAIWFMHGLGSITVDSPWRLPRLSEYGKFVAWSLFFKLPETMT